MIAETLLKNLGLPLAGTYDDLGDFVVDIKGSEEFGRVYSKLDNSDMLEYREENGILTEDEANLNYTYEDELLISLTADFENDYYKLTITEI